MKSAEFLLFHSNDDGIVIVDACRSVELQAVDFCAVAWNGGPILELFTIEDYQRTMDKIKSLPPEDQSCLSIYIANFSRIWNETRTQAAIPAFLCEYANIKEKAIYFEAGDGKKYLCSSTPQSQP